jgi:hypothetical protein
MHQWLGLFQSWSILLQKLSSRSLSLHSLQLGGSICLLIGSCSTTSYINCS